MIAELPPSGEPRPRGPIVPEAYRSLWLRDIMPDTGVLIDPIWLYLDTQGQLAIPSGLAVGKRYIISLTNESAIQLGKVPDDDFAGIFCVANQDYTQRKLIADLRHAGSNGIFTELPMTIEEHNEEPSAAGRLQILDQLTYWDDGRAVIDPEDDEYMVERAVMWSGVMDAVATAMAQRGAAAARVTDMPALADDAPHAAALQSYSPRYM